jgi:uncharacterized protein YndB with AHSA1/START domain
MFTDPEWIKRWISALANFKLDKIHMDLKLGGIFVYEFTDAQGKPRKLSGQYTSLQNPEHITCTWDWEGSTAPQPMCVTLEFIAHGADTEITVIHDLIYDNGMYERYKTSWQKCLDRITDLCAESEKQAA